MKLKTLVSFFYLFCLRSASDEQRNNSTVNADCIFEEQIHKTQEKCFQ